MLLSKLRAEFTRFFGVSATAVRGQGEFAASHKDRDFGLAHPGNNAAQRANHRQG